MRSLAIIAIALVFLSVSNQARAWKIDVHIWIAEQVLADIQDGDLDLLLDGRRVSVPVEAQELRALRNHPKMYLLGSIGPDAFPGAFSGQLVIHPSVQGGWGTSDWLAHLLEDNSLSDAERAFALGFASHVASDVFAHTFVNRYAGDVFELTEHEWAAIRHIHVESYVSNFLPGVLDRATGRTTDAATAVRTNEKIEIPEDLLVRKIFLNADAMGQMEKSGFAPHLVGARNLHRTLDDFVSDDGLLIEIEALVIQYLAELYLEIPISNEQAKELQKLSNKINEELNNLSADASKILQDLNTELHKIEGFQIDLHEDLLNVAVDVSSQLADAHIAVANEILKLKRLENELLGIDSTIEEVKTEIVEGSCRTVTTILTLGLVDEKEVCDEVTKIITKANPDFLRKEAEIRLVEAAIGTAEELKRSLDRDLREAIREGFDAIRKAHDKKLELTNQLISYLESNPFGPPHRRRFEQWRDSIPVALYEFSRANAEAIVNSVDPSDPSIFEPLQDWLICYGPVFISIPAFAGDTVCAGLDAFREIKEEIDEFERELADVLPVLGEAIRLKQKIEDRISRLKDEVLTGAITTGLSEFDKIANTNSTYIFKGLTQHVGEDELNDVMRQDRGGQGLPRYIDAAQRINAEMAVANGTFNPDRFHAAFNSVVLSKLSVLDDSGLRALARRAGVGSSVYGSSLYDGRTEESRNILYGFARNIDGNHHWHVLAPPHPRVNGGIEQTDFLLRASTPDRRFGRFDDFCSTEKNLGMRMWVDELAREKLFKALFRGPVASGVDRPQQLGQGFSDVLPAGYPTQLFQDDGWNEDGLKYYQEISSATTSFDVSVVSPIEGEVVVSVGDLELHRAALVQDDTTYFTFEVPSAMIPAKITFENLRSNGALHSKRIVDAGCNQQSIEQTLLEPEKLAIVRGDNLWKLTKALVGDGRRYPELVEANIDAIDDPDLIYPGQIFTVPWDSGVEVKLAN
ncbi:zinc dependent phospholipase C family protein [uncultured Tateyamaria sp.]|uniref:zinc dependent phospholipase C family protein n=1 Tax=uncultured Tateyamaria sp. TaxID=455651 RepID=UPI0026338AEE|nr:zinc dependent phospholipase C family protein [uncultured Tateyamaria sp.]